MNMSFDKSSRVTSRRSDSRLKYITDKCWLIHAKTNHNLDEPSKTSQAKLFLSLAQLSSSFLLLNYYNPCLTSVTLVAGIPQICEEAISQSNRLMNTGFIEYSLSIRIFYIFPTCIDSLCLVRCPLWVAWYSHMSQGYFLPSCFDCLWVVRFPLWVAW